MKLNINDKEYDLNIEPDMPLLWVLRDELNLTGTKYGCGIAACGACSVTVDGVTMRSCVLPAGELEDAKITTIEAMSDNNAMTDLQQAWIDFQVPQCGYCQSGMLVATEQLLVDYPNPTDDEISSMLTNICRCGTYNRVRKAIKAVAKQRSLKPSVNQIG